MFKSCIRKPCARGKGRGAAQILGKEVCNFFHGVAPRVPATPPEKSEKILRKVGIDFAPRIQAISHENLVLISRAESRQHHMKNWDGIRAQDLDAKLSPGVGARY